MGFWERQATEIAVGATSQLGWYGWRADQLIKVLLDLNLTHLTNGNANMIEIGSGPVGIASFFPALRRVAVDPLDGFYARNPVLIAKRDAGVEYREGTGEALPCESDDFDLVVIENCIDHVQDVHRVMCEIRRALRPGGTLYLTVNCRTASGYWVHRLLSRLRIDAGHPHTFTSDCAERLLHYHGFTILRTWYLQTYRDSRRADLASRIMKDRLKAYLRVSEFAVAMIGHIPDKP